MIKIKRPAMPEILKVHHTEWTKTLADLVTQYGGYDRIPVDEKNQVVNEYQHDDIKEAVKKMFHGKCVFCEEHIETVSYTHIEHFHPKSTTKKLLNGTIYSLFAVNVIYPKEITIPKKTLLSILKKITLKNISSIKIFAYSLLRNHPI